MPALAALVLTACMQSAPGPVTQAPQTHIRWDTWGVPHIFAASDEELFFADGWAQMHAHANTILKLYGASRGRAAEYWGESHLESDLLVHTLGHPERATVMWKEQNPELKQIITAFTTGMNAYAARHPGAIDADNRPVLPLTVDDVNMHSLFVVNTRFLAGRELWMAGKFEEAGSNSYAIGPGRSASGRAMLLQNPHLPWSNEFLFFEKHAITRRNNIYGTTLVGFPGFAIAFNEHLGWSHTNNTIDTADLYELTLAGDGYLLDGAPTSFNETDKTLKVKSANGELTDTEVKIRRSVHGPVVKYGETRALALRMAGSDSHDSVLQWWRMANAQNFTEFEAALGMAHLAFWNVMYADREGNIFYLFNGQVPVRPHGGWDYWSGIVPGNESTTLWTEYHGYDELPKLLNPAAGWLQNANDPPWTSTLPMELDAGDFPPYMAPRGMGFRPQRAARMIMEDASITFDELQDYKHDTRMELADRILDDLLAALSESGSETALEAASILASWDRRADPESVGAALFFNWAVKMNPNDLSNYALPWDEADPRNTPDGLADPQRMVELLETVAGEMRQQYGRLDVKWGEVHRIRYNGRDLPGNGAPGALGVFRVAGGGPPSDGVRAIGGGDSWVGVIEFGDKPQARVLLSYGNSTQPGSPHYGDQLELFSRQKLRAAWFSEEQLEGNVERSEWLEAGYFVEKN
jgi:acyl-homoserine-lactone acylase